MPSPTPQPIDTLYVYIALGKSGRVVDVCGCIYTLILVWVVGCLPTQQCMHTQQANTQANHHPLHTKASMHHINDFGPGVAGLAQDALVLYLAQFVVALECHFERISCHHVR